MLFIEFEIVMRVKVGVEFWLEMFVFLNFEFFFDWDFVLRDWKYFWEFYYIGFGVLFFGVVVFFCICVVKIKYRVRGMMLVNYFFVVCLMLMMFSVLRILYLFFDFYELYIVLDFLVLLSRIIFVIGYFCLILVLLLIYFVFFEVNKF